MDNVADAQIRCGNSIVLSHSAMPAQTPITREGFGYTHLYKVHTRGLDVIEALASRHMQDVSIISPERNLTLCFSELGNTEDGHSDGCVLKGGLTNSVIRILEDDIKLSEVLKFTTVGRDVLYTFVDTGFTQHGAREVFCVIGYISRRPGVCQSPYGNKVFLAGKRDVRKLDLSAVHRGNDAVERQARNHLW